jgi:hypothetical protein
MVRLTRQHYGWIVAGVTFLTIMLAAGIRSIPGVLILPLESEFGWNRASISLAISINLLLSLWSLRPLRRLGDGACWHAPADVGRFGHTLGRGWTDVADARAVAAPASLGRSR